MKHIKKKYLFQKEGSFNNLSSNLKTFNTLDQNILKEINKKEAYLEMEGGYVVKALVHNHNGKPAIIPIPDLTLVYYDSAYDLNVLRKKQEKILFEKVLIKETNLGEEALNEIYRYYGYSSSCIISLFTTLESFVNHLIPNDKPYFKKQKQKTEIYDKSQIQNYIQFDEKIKEVLPYFFDGITFFKVQNNNTQLIENLKMVRNEIVHPKSEITFKAQEELIKKILKFNYDSTFRAVAAFINLYKPNYIIECDCDNNY
jgi:hypothetical protein